ncbi:hypothetical protein CKA32_002484 [Geitlerinema sp. FC II]|nr:hypothetical protein CKA32_002484 [Geitlerinema sp. FC II]
MKTVTSRQSLVKTGNGERGTVNSFSPSPLLPLSPSPPLPFSPWERLLSNSGLG